ncbi:MAG: hypothetical protein IPP72_03060 [Chitinophagaceae bacterium]|nr:hypothetical protein [Chitinophagaceae bacterium]
MNITFTYRELSVTFFILLALSSCATLKPADKATEITPLTKDNLPILNGSYEILSVDTSTITLDFCLTFNRYYIDWKAAFDLTAI